MKKRFRWGLSNPDSVGYHKSEAQASSARDPRKARSLTVYSTCGLNKMSYYDVLVDALSSQALKVFLNLDQLRTICDEVAAEAKKRVAYASGT